MSLRNLLKICLVFLKSELQYPYKRYAYKKTCMFKYILNDHISIDIEYYSFLQSCKCTDVRFPRKLLHVILTLLVHVPILVLPSLYQEYNIEDTKFKFNFKPSRFVDS